MAAQLSLMPNELFLRIALSVEEVNDLRSFARTCKRFHRLADEALYSAFSNQETSSALTTRLFHRTMVETPALALLVRRIKWSMAEPDLREVMHRKRHDWYFRAFRSGVAKESLRLLHKAAVPLAAEMGLRDRWVRDVRDDIESAKLALLLCQVPNLEELSIVWPLRAYHIVHVVRAAATRASAGKEGALAKLRGVSINAEMFEPACLLDYPFSSTKAAPFFHLPSLKTFAARYCVQRRAGENDWKFPESGTSSVAHICLEQSHLDIATVSALVRACRSLESLEYDSCRRSGSRGIGCSHRAIVSALQCQKPSLEYLKLGFGCPIEPDARKPGKILRFAGDLREFSQLRNLECDQVVLIGREYPWKRSATEGLELTDILPASVEHLTINHCGKHIAYHLSRLAAACCAQRFENLRIVEVRMYGLRSLRNPSALMSEFDKAGVKFDYSDSAVSQACVTQFVLGEESWHYRENDSDDEDDEGHPHELDGNERAELTDEEDEILAGLFSSAETDDAEVQTTRQ